MSGRARRRHSQTLPRLALSTVIDRSRNSRQTYSAPSNRGRRAGLAPADLGDFLGRVLGAAAVAGGHRGDGDRAALLGQEGQRAGALKFDVVRMGMNCQDSRRGEDAIEFAEGDVGLMSNDYARGIAASH